MVEEACSTGERGGPHHRRSGLLRPRIPNGQDAWLDIPARVVPLATGAFEAATEYADRRTVRRVARARRI